MSRSFHGLDTTGELMLPIVLCEYERCYRTARLVGGPTYPRSEHGALATWRMSAEAREVARQAVAKRHALLSVTPLPAGWLKLTIAHDDGAEAHEYCSYRCLRLAARRFEAASSRKTESPASTGDSVQPRGQE